jgi:polyferredoxin
VRLRTLAYALLLLVVAAIMATALANRTSVGLSVLRDRSPLFVTLADGSLRNGYTIRVLNKTLATRRFVLRTEGLARPELSVVGDDRPGALVTLDATPDQASTYRLYVHLARDAVRAEATDFAFVLEEIGGLGERARVTTEFRGPVGAGGEGKGGR